MANDFEHEFTSCWEAFRSEEQQREMEELATYYLPFLSSCKTERRTVEFVRSKAKEAGFTEHVADGALVRSIKDKSVILARRGKRPLSDGVRIIGAHADTPRLDFKQHPLYESCDLALAKTHYYGGIRKHQWFSRPLALHGVVVRTDGTKIEVRIGEDPEDPVFVIADLLPHLASKQNEQKLSQAFEGEKMNLLLGHRPEETASEEPDESGRNAKGNGKRKVKKRILELLWNKYHIVEEDLFSAEIQAVPAGAARWVGLEGDLIGGYGQDDRICVYAALQALLAETQPELSQVVIFWDKEEIGSEGATSARALFFEYTLQELIEAWEPQARLSRVLEQSKALSADVHGGMDPDYQDLHDQLNASKLGFGPVFCKYTGHRGKIGANDASAEYVAWLRNLLNSASIPWQMAEIGKVDAGGGGTVAKHLAVYGLDIIDVGPSLLAMHSPFEISSKADLYATYLAYREFLR